MTIDGALAGTVWTPASGDLVFEGAEPFAPGRHVVGIHWQGQSCSWSFTVGDEPLAAKVPASAAWLDTAGPDKGGVLPPELQVRWLGPEAEPGPEGGALCPPVRKPPDSWLPPLGHIAADSCHILTPWRLVAEAAGEGLEPFLLYFAPVNTWWGEEGSDWSRREFLGELELCLADEGYATNAPSTCLERLEERSGRYYGFCMWGQAGTVQYSEGAALWALEPTAYRVCEEPWYLVVWNRQGGWRRFGPLPIPEELAHTTRTDPLSGGTTYTYRLPHGREAPYRGGYGMPWADDPHVIGEEITFE